MICPECGKPLARTETEPAKCEPFVDDDGREWIGTEMPLHLIHTDGTECVI